MGDAMSIPIKPPPRGEDLPNSDGEPMETQRHVQQMLLLISSLEDAWRDRSDFFVAGNMFVYFSETQARNNDFRGPDVFVVMDTVRRERKSWVVWEEDGRTPNVVIELLSESTEHVDRGDKMRIYAKMLHVGEYYLFDPFTGELEGYALDAATRIYERRTADLPGGDFSSKATGLALGVREGKLGGTEAPWLRWLTRDGGLVMTGSERADAERLHADEARQHADEARARAAAAEARVAELEARLGIEPRR